MDETWLERSRGEPTRPRRLGRPNLGEEKELIETALVAANGRVAGPDGAAARLGIPRSTLESKIRSLRIDKHRFKTP